MYVDTCFLLIVILGTGEDAKQEFIMYFRSIDVCQYYAKRIPRQYGNYRYKDLVPSKHRITAYCKPVYVQDGDYIYDH